MDRCYYCERKFNIANYGTNKPCAKTIDHIIPISKQGSNKPDNMVRSCIECNNLKADLTLDEFIEIVNGLIEDKLTYKTIPDTRLHTIIRNSLELQKYVIKNEQSLIRGKDEKHVSDIIPKFTDVISKLHSKFKVIADKKLNKTTERLGFYDNPIKLKSDVRQLDEEHQLFLMHQTPEQFELAKKHGWKFAKILTEPECNFHY